MMQEMADDVDASLDFDISRSAGFHFTAASSLPPGVDGDDGLPADGLRAIRAGDAPSD
jgi:hypothetical protein